MQKNITLFIVLSAAILGLWVWMQPVPEPEAPGKKKAEAAVSKVDPLQQADRWEAAAARLVVDRNPVSSDWFSLARDVRAVELARYPKAVAKAEPKKEEKKEAAQPAVESVVEATLGGETEDGKGTHLEAVFTSRGAGIRRLTLRRFEAANYLGRPTDTKLELIQDDPIVPSYTMYHFTDLQEKARPDLGLGEVNWKLEEKTSNTVRFSTYVPGQPHIKISKTYSLRPTDYHLGLQIEVQDERPTEGADTEQRGFRYQIVGARGMPIEGEWYATVFRNAVSLMVDANGSLWRELEDAPEDSARISLRKGGNANPAGNRGTSWLLYAGTVNQYFASLVVVDDEQPSAAEGGMDRRDVLAWCRPTLETTEKPGRIVGLSEHSVEFADTLGKVSTYTMLPRMKHHLLTELKFEKGSEGVLSYYETPGGQLVATWIRRGQVVRPQLDDITMRVNSELLKLKPGDKVAHRFLLYHGPVKTALLGTFHGDAAVPWDTITRYRDTLHLRTLTDYRSSGPFGWFSQKIYFTDLIIVFTRLMHWLLNLLHMLIGNYGLTVILLTFIVRIAMYPVSRRQALFSQKMQELAPEMKKLQERYKDDMEGRSRAVHELYAKHKVNPALGCLPVFLQMPIFLGLYFALQESVQFRLAPFLWIENLAAPDMLLYWTESIPVISDPDSSSGMLGMFYLGPYLNILPIIAVVLMAIQQQQMMKPPADEQEEMQQKMMKYMTIFFGVLFFKVASGLVIYFIVSSLWGMAERKLLPKKPAGTLPATVAPDAIQAKQPYSNPKKNRGRTAVKPANGQPDAIQKLKAWWEQVLKDAQKK